METVTGAACAGMLPAVPGAAALVPVAHAVASAPTATMPAPALLILRLTLPFGLIACLSGVGYMDSYGRLCEGRVKWW